MNAGELRERVTVQSLTYLQDENTGEVKENWANFGTFWAKFMHLSSKEKLQAQAIQSELNARLMVRYHAKTAQINSTMRVIYRNQIYNIIGLPIADNNSGRQWLTIELASVST